jgi:hypothetical protein
MASLRGNTAVGTITAAGVYTAPADLPSLALVEITATSNAETTKSVTASVTVVSDVMVSIAPNSASVELGALQKFRATIASSGHPDSAIRWSVTGAACATGCGSIDANGNYTAPRILPGAAAATVVAHSVADPSKQASATLAITSSFSLQLSAPASVPVGGVATLTATLIALTGSNPNNGLAWSLSGAGCSALTCGTLSATSTKTSGGYPSVSTVTYTAPAVAPIPNAVVVTVTSLADATKQSQLTISVQSGISVSVSPVTATLASNNRTTLTVQVFGSANTGVAWSVNGIAAGNSAIGQICVTAVTPCQPVTGTDDLQVDYLAPGAIPNPNPVTVQATSLADLTKIAAAQITVINHVVVSILPNPVTLTPLATQAFTATVLGTTNQNVTWQIQGSACSIAGACGSVDTNGNYIAPGAAPSPDAVQVIAVSADDTSQSGSANVTITTGVQISGLHPASVYTGAADGFTLLVDGANFAATSPGPGSTLLIGGTARTTTCNSATTCTAPVIAADVAVAGNVSVQISNPDGTNSSVVSLVVVAPNITGQVIGLSGSAPAAAGQDIVVVEPTTEGVSATGSDVDLNVAALGTFSTANNSCTLAGNPVTLVRPSSGTITADICVFSESGLDTSMTYSVTGPGDVSVISKQPAGLGIIHLTLQIASSANPGARTIFIQNTNLDETAASGALEVQ